MQWDKIVLPQGDVLVFAGDALGNGSRPQWDKFVLWLKGQAPAYKVVLVTAGNHDRCLEDMDKSTIKAAFSGTNIHYLEDEEIVIDGVKFYMYPWTPKFMNWSFMTKPDEARRICAKIPEDVDVLVTHGPPRNILDRTDIGDSVGCQELADRLVVVRPRVHIFGHIHEAYGQQENNGIRHFNVSTCDIRYNPMNPVVVIDL